MSYRRDANRKATKIGTQVTLSHEVLPTFDHSAWVAREMGIAMGSIVLSPEEKADRAARVAQAKADEARRAKAIHDTHHRLLAAAGPGIVAGILTLHAPNSSGLCPGCDSDGYETESPAWPCRTVELIATIYGITIAEAL